MADKLPGRFDCMERRFGIEGLLGSPVDILFKLEMYNGRVYESMLSPVNAFFISSQIRPSTFELLWQEAIN